LRQRTASDYSRFFDGADRVLREFEHANDIHLVG